MKNMNKRILAIALAMVIAILLVVASYVIYVLADYYRIDDHTPLEIVNPQEKRLSSRTTHTIMTYNIGFGAYGPEYSFFMDKGRMADGTETQGRYGKSISIEHTMRNTEGAIGIMQELDPEFMFIQEVDWDSDRSQHVDQVDMIRSAFPGKASTLGVNFHTSYLFYPFNDPHGKNNAGIMTLSDYAIGEAERRSYPVDDSIMKVTDLDRCFAVHRIPVDNGRELVLINSHMSAYDKGGLIRKQQWQMVTDVLKDEYAKGNYVILGGDFNHVLGDASREIFPSGQITPEWLAFISDSDIPEHFSIARAGNFREVPTCRGADIPWEKGVTYTCIVDGFIVSDNISWKTRNIDTDFQWADHQPVLMEFTLE